MKEKKQNTSNETMVFLSEFHLADGQELNEENILDAKFEIIRTGKFYDQRYGSFKVDKKLFNELKANFDNNVLEVDVAVDKGHMPGEGAFAWIDQLFLKGSSMFMSLKDITPEGMDMLLNKKFKYFSVEFGPFEKPVKGKAKAGDPQTEVFESVLRGVALTNRPVIKGMRDKPLFFSEDSNSILSSHSVAMETFKKLSELVSEKENISQAQFEMLNTAFSTLSEEQQVEVKEELEAAEAKVSEEAPAATEGGEAKTEEVKNLSEIVNAQQVELSELRAMVKGQETEKRLSEVTLSETNKTGFTAEAIKAVRKFAEGLSEAKWSEFKAILKSYKTIDLSEKGSDQLILGEENSATALQKEFSAKIAEKQAEGKSYADAVLEARREDDKFKSLR